MLINNCRNSFDTAPSPELQKFWFWPAGGSLPQPSTASPGTSLSRVLPQDSDYAPLNLYPIGGNNDRRHLGVCWLQAHVLAFEEESLQGGIAAFNQRDHNLPISRRFALLHQHVIAIHNVLILHARARDLQHENFFGAGEVAQRNALRILHRLDRAAGGNASNQRKRRLLQTCRLASAHWQHVDGTAAVLLPLQQAFTLQISDVLVHRSQRAEIEPLANLLK